MGPHRRARHPVRRSAAGAEVGGVRALRRGPHLTPCKKDGRFMLEHPALSCRTYPPQGGRSKVAIAFASHQRWRSGETLKLPISPVEREMCGRTEGGGN